MGVRRWQAARLGPGDPFPPGKPLKSQTAQSDKGSATSRSEKLPAQIESDEPVVATGRSTSKLTNRATETIGNVELEEVPPGPLLYPE